MATAKKAAPATKAPAKAPAKKAAPVAKTTPAAKTPAAKKAAPAKAETPTKKATEPVKKSAPAPAPVAKKAAPAPKPPVKKGGKVVLDKWQEKQKELLQTERAEYLRQVVELRNEADQMMRDAEPGDVQFDDESGEGASVALERERDLALASQHQGIVEEIEDALRKLERGTYGACESCGKMIMKARLEALPYARQCIDCKQGGLSRR
ncbi:MAG: TraR/DksA C4-type zinc finger protein [Acidimicrobiales bacterium]|nr:TraR/DksA C4-type zinc finger protein [Acidimicrobiales bacterium]